MELEAERLKADNDELAPQGFLNEPYLKNRGVGLLR
jgi:hypothetical protein